MPVWRRYLVRETSGRLIELPSRVLDRADDGVAPLPDFAGRCIELVAAVLVAGEGGEPRLAEVEFTKMYFDASGFVDVVKRDRMIRLMLESCADRRCVSPTQPGCIDAAMRADAARFALEREFGWKPKPAEVHEVMHRLDGLRWMAGPPTLH
ncbi:MAG TPA: hypothetical protein VD978_29060 [Azospirillum sp.]|nr:hypothetical protein [Azospirillum sp.]